MCVARYLFVKTSTIALDIYPVDLNFAVISGRAWANKTAVLNEGRSNSRSYSREDK